MAWLQQRVLVPLVLVAALCVTFVLYRMERSHAALERRSALESDLRDLVGRIEQRMLACEQVLRGAQGFVLAAPTVDPAAFHSYVDALQLGADFAGMQGVGIVGLVTAGERAAHVAALRRLRPDYDIVPAGERELYTPILQVEPPSVESRRALGYDPYASPVRRKAMEQARDSGAAALTARVRLIDGVSPDDEAGFVMFMPLYRNGLRHASIAERRAHLRGWVMAPFRMKELMAGLYGDLPASMNVQIHDGVEAGAATLMYSSREAGQPAAAPQATEYLTVAGRTWTLRLYARDEPAAVAALTSAQIVAIAGVLTSALLALLTWGLLKGRNLAQALAHDMTQELQQSEARFRRLAQYDELTELPNRALLADRLRLAVAQARRDQARLALMYIDLDRFKPVNDAHGHAAGDQLLRAVAQRLVACVRESDTVARIGGDEFVVLLPGVHQDDDALGVADKIRHALQRSFDVDTGGGTCRVDISASIGVAFYPEHGRDEAQLSTSADDAMYRAKATGRDCISVAQRPVLSP